MRGRTRGLADLMAAAPACEHPPGVLEGGHNPAKLHEAEQVLSPATMQAKQTNTMFEN
jgi:hypothetical protein